MYTLVVRKATNTVIDGQKEIKTTIRTNGLKDNKDKTKQRQKDKRRQKDHHSNKRPGQLHGNWRGGVPQ